MNNGRNLPVSTEAGLQLGKVSGLISAETHKRTASRGVKLRPNAVQGVAHQFDVATASKGQP